VWGATPRCGSEILKRRVSIHAPRVGSDAAVEEVSQSMKVSIHAPRVGSDAFRASSGKTPGSFNPRPPCGERHSPAPTKSPKSRFQSTPPVWGATTSDTDYLGVVDVSIHAPRVGSDLWPSRSFGGILCFNPRPPCGERQSGNFATASFSTFQSTPPVWGATPLPQTFCLPFQVSIHAPRVGSDSG